MNELITQLISTLNDLKITLTIFSTASGITISFIGFLLALKAYKKNKEKSHQNERRTFVNDCEPLINNKSLTAHEEMLLINSYHSIKGDKLDVDKLKKLTQLSKTYATLNHFILAGNLIEIKNNRVIKKPTSIFIRILRKIKAISLSAIVLGFYFLAVFGIPNFLNQFVTDETKNGVALLYIILVSVGISVMLWAFKHLIPIIDSIYPLKQLLLLNQLPCKNHDQEDKDNIKPQEVVSKPNRAVIPRKFPKRYFASAKLRR
ncbi:hypothetical protein EHLJMEHL_04344 [Vreelandella titanicae]